MVRESNACRLFGVDVLGPCEGALQWAHYGDWRRFKTVGKPPEERHTTKGSLGLCDRHHDLYDGQCIGKKFDRLKIDHLTPLVCDGPLRFELGGVVYIEEQ